MKKTIKRITNSIAMCTLALGLLSGCGGRFTEEMTAGKDGAGAVTGSAVSGQAVSGQAVQSDDHEGGINGRHCSEHYYYEAAYLNDDREDVGVVQISLDTYKEKGYAIDGICEVVYVEKDALYYTKKEDEDEYGYYYSLWQMPIECHADGAEELKIDQAEKLKGLDDIYFTEHAIYIDDEYIVYIGRKGKSEGLDSSKYDVIRYDRKSAEKVSMPDSTEGEDYWTLEINEIHRYGDRLYVITDCCIVSWDIRTGEVSVLEYGDQDVWAFVNMGTLIFYCDECLDEGGGNPDIKCIDMQTEKMTEIVSKKEILDVLTEEVRIQEKQLKRVNVDSMYYDANCLYIDLHVDYKKGDTIYECYIMLSRNDEEGAQLKYEKGLTEYMWEKEEKFDPFEGAKVGKTKCGECYAISKGMAYVLPHEDDKMVIYDLKTGKVRPEDWKDELMLEY